MFLSKVSFAFVVIFSMKVCSIEVFIPIEKCNENQILDCYNDGICYKAADIQFCLCPHGFRGQQCEMLDRYVFERRKKRSSDRLKDLNVINPCTGSDKISCQNGTRCYEYSRNLNKGQFCMKV